MPARIRMNRKLVLQNLQHSEMINHFLPSNTCQITVPDVEVEWDGDEHEEHVDPLTHHEDDLGLGVIARVLLILLQNSKPDADVHCDDVHGIFGTLRKDKRMRISS